MRTLLNYLDYKGGLPFILASPKRPINLEYLPLTDRKPSPRLEDVREPLSGPVPRTPVPWGPSTPYQRPVTDTELAVERETQRDRSRSSTHLGLGRDIRTDFPIDLSPGSELETQKTVATTSKGKGKFIAYFLPLCTANDRQELENVVYLQEGTYLDQPIPWAGHYIYAAPKGERKPAFYPVQHGFTDPKD